MRKNNWGEVWAISIQNNQDGLHTIWPQSSDLWSSSIDRWTCLDLGGLTLSRYVGLRCMWHCVWRFHEYKSWWVELIWSRNNQEQRFHAHDLKAETLCSIPLLFWFGQHPIHLTWSQFASWDRFPWWSSSVNISTCELNVVEIHDSRSGPGRSLGWINWRGAWTPLLSG